MHPKAFLLIFYQCVHIKDKSRFLFCLIGIGLKILQVHLLFCSFHENLIFLHRKMYRLIDLNYFAYSILWSFQLAVVLNRLMIVLV